MSLLDSVRADLIRDEGVRKFPYTDTVGKLTIGGDALWLDIVFKIGGH